MSEPKRLNFTAEERAVLDVFGAAPANTTPRGLMHAVARSWGRNPEVVRQAVVARRNNRRRTAKAAKRNTPWSHTEDAVVRDALRELDGGKAGYYFWHRVHSLLPGRTYRAVLERASGMKAGRVA